MERIFEQALLYDFYGELLTEHQRSIYEDAVYNDMSLGEIAEERGISRQGVHDLIRRCDKILLEYEAKLHLAERFTNAKGQIGEIIRLTQWNEVPGQGKGSMQSEVPIPNRTRGQNEAFAAKMQEADARLLRIRELAGQLLDEL